MVVFLMRRLQGVRGGLIVLATTELAADDELAAIVSREGVPVFRGANADVVARYVGAAEHFGFDTVARVTGDCPFVDADLVDWCLGCASEVDQADLATTKGQFPAGLDVEIYGAPQMAQLHASGMLSAEEREHLTLHFYRHPDVFAIWRLAPPAGWTAKCSHFTVDTRADYEMAAAFASHFDGPQFPVNALLARAAL